MKIRKAIIPAAGTGTRFLPITATINKEMLPILTRPVIDYVVEDCINAGIEEIIFVVRKGDTQIRDFYTENTTTLRYLESNKKEEKYLEHLARISSVIFTFVEQEIGPDKPYGTSIPLKLCYEHVKDEPRFAVLMGDDFIFYKNGKSLLNEMNMLLTEASAQGVITCREIPWETVSRYGVVEFEERSTYKFMTNIVEKPVITEATSNLANVSKYLLTPDIFEFIFVQQPDPILNEYLLTTPLLAYAQSQNIAILIPSGEYMDCGTPDGWLAANDYIHSAKNSNLIK